MDDARRDVIFEALKIKVGLTPAEIFNAPMAKLDEVTKLGGALYQQRSLRIKECALIALNEFGGDLRLALQLPMKKAIKALKQFPGIGEPGAEKILLLTNTHPVLALDSNGLRVLLRIGFGVEKKNYSASYKAVRESTVDQVSSDCDALIEAHLLYANMERPSARQLNRVVINVQLTPSVPIFLRADYLHTPRIAPINTNATIM